MQVGERLNELLRELETRELPRCFCHNDLSNTNLHLDPSTGRRHKFDRSYHTT